MSPMRGQPYNLKVTVVLMIIVMTSGVCSFPRVLKNIMPKRKVGHIMNLPQK